MIKITDNKTEMTVDFKNAANKQISGKLLTYEICGEACVLVGSDRQWIPFSRLSRTSRDKIMGTGSSAEAESRDRRTFEDARPVIITTLLALICLSYYYVKFNA